MLDAILRNCRDLWSPGERFKSAIAMAQRLENAQNGGALLDLVRLLARPLQTELTTRYGVDKNLFKPTSAGDLWPVITIEEHSRLHEERSQEERCKDEIIDLKNDIVLLWPWNYGRIQGVLETIGNGGSRGPWQYQDPNHKVEFWLPVRIGFVQGGNHSIMMGILQGEGQFPAREVCDLASLYERFETDGRYYYRRGDRQLVCKAGSPEWAAIFEIGRMLMDPPTKPECLSAQ